MIAEKEKNGFTSLSPVFDQNEKLKTEVFRDFKIEQNSQLLKKIAEGYPQSIGSIEVDIDFENDELIADEFFAAVLNRDREIEVEGIIYKFTEKGIFYSSKDKYQDLLASVAAYSGSVDSELTTLDNGVMLFAPNKVANKNCNDCREGNNDGINTSILAAPQAAKNALKICYWDPNIWDDIFGPAENCLDYFDSKKRIKTRVWSQNYLLFSSAGVKVASQKKVLGIWWADKIDEVELGYTAIYFEYDIPQPTWPNSSFVFQYEYNGVIIDQYGRYVRPAFGGTSSIFDKFPINDPDKRLLTIYLFQPLESILGKSSIDLTANDVNNGIESLVKQGFSALSSYLKKEMNGSAVIVYPSAQNDKLKFLFTNWIKTKKNDNKISETFDWNTAVIGFSSKGSSTSPVYDSPKSYKKFMAIVYGMGRKGSTWKGSKVILDDSK